MSEALSMDIGMQALEHDVLVAEEAYLQALETYKAAHDRLALVLSRIETVR